MTSRRLVKSAVNWKAFGDRVSDANLPFFKKFKTLSDTYSGKIASLPDALPKIDFAHYKSLGAPAAVVDKFEKAYGSAEVSYPVDTSNALAKIDKEFDEVKTKRVAFIKEQNKSIASLSEMLDACSKVFPPEDEWTIQLYNAYFPDCMMDIDRPTMWPHAPHNVEFFGEEIASISQPTLEMDLTSVPLYRIPYADTVKIDYTKAREPDLSDVFYTQGYEPSKEELEKLQKEWPGVIAKYKEAYIAKQKKFFKDHADAVRADKEYKKQQKKQKKALKEAKKAKEAGSA